jgi:hypothetical protein
MKNIFTQSYNIILSLKQQDNKQNINNKSLIQHFSTTNNYKQKFG